MERQRVDWPRKPLGKHAVDPLVTFDAALTRELLCHQHYFKMGLGVRRHAVTETLIFHSELTGLERSLERCRDFRLTVIRVSAYPGMLFYVEIAIECF